MTYVYSISYCVYFMSWPDSWKKCLLLRVQRKGCPPKLVLALSVTNSNGWLKLKALILVNFLYFQIFLLKFHCFFTKIKQMMD